MQSAGLIYLTIDCRSSDRRSCRMPISAFILAFWTPRHRGLHLVHWPCTRHASTRMAVAAEEICKARWYIAGPFKRFRRAHFLHRPLPRWPRASWWRQEMTPPAMLVHRAMPPSPVECQITLRVPALLGSAEATKRVQNVEYAELTVPFTGQLLAQRHLILLNQTTLK